MPGRPEVGDEESDRLAVGLDRARGLVLRTQAPGIAVPECGKRGIMTYTTGASGSCHQGTFLGLAKSQLSAVRAVWLLPVPGFRSSRGSP